MDATIAIIVAVVWLTEWGTASTHVHRIDKFHVASFASHFPAAIYLLWDEPWWVWVIAAVGAQIIWRLVIARSGIGWESFWLRFFKRFN